MDSTIRTRIAPAPTGPCHVGIARTALFNYLFTRKHGGTFLMRLEDTDVSRSRKEFEEDVYEGLRWLGLDWDEGPDVGGDFGPYRQSERKEIYQVALQKLLEAGLAYPCFCTAYELQEERKRRLKLKLPPRYSGKCQKLSRRKQEAAKAEGKPYSIRFQMPDRRIAFDDMIRGRVEFDGAEIGDFVIVKPDGDFIFHLSNVVDDIEMKITHVIRGEDHVSNTPRHIALAEALGIAPPTYGHIPLILNPDRSKMSKRKNPTSVSDYRQWGYLPEAVVNFLALIGWSSGTEREVFSLDELVEAFSIEAVGRAGAIFDIEKLNWLNGHYIRALPPEKLQEKLSPYLPDADANYLRQIVPLIQERLKRLDEAPALTDFFFREELEYDPALLVAKKHTPEESKAALDAVLDRISAIEQFSVESLEKALRGLVEDIGWKTGHLFMSIRVAVTGSTATPPLFETMSVLGRERCVSRIRLAVERLSEMIRERH
jgi:glutamyl-tRNA synthetase